MEIYLGTEVSFEVIKQWIKTVNNEFGLTDKNDASYRFFESMKNFYIFILDPVMYAVLEPATDMWGTKEMNVVSFYIMKEHRSLKNLNLLQEKIEEIARAFNVKVLNQGAHLDERLFLYLKRKGYKQASMRKELKWEK